MNSTCFESLPSAATTLLETVRVRLANNELVSSPRALFDNLHWTDVSVRFDAQPLMEDLPDLADRFRGALGRALERHRTKGDDVWSLLFGPQIELSNGAVTRPYLVKATRIRQEIHCLVRLFGFVDCWAKEILEALVEAGTGGIAIRMHGKLRAKLQPIETDIHTQFWSMPVCRSTQAKVKLASPLIIRHRQSLHGDMERFFFASSLRRVLGVASWCGVKPDHAALTELSSASWSVTDMDLYPVSWVRYSSNHEAGRTHAGMMGSFLLSEISELNRSILQVVELFNAGGGATSGYGQLAIFD